MSNTKAPSETTYLLELNSAPRNVVAARLTLLNFVLFAILASTNVCCVIACIALATARLGSIGAWQSGTLYLTYTLSALLGATFVVKRLGGRSAIMVAMSLYCSYILCFTLAISTVKDVNLRMMIALIGAGIGGIGGGIFWTAQGAYFAQAAEEHSLYSGTEWAGSTSLLAGIFAFIFLAEETFLDLLTMVLAQHAEWSRIFALYAAIAVLSTIGMMCVKEYPLSPSRRSESAWYKITAALQLLRNDAKMKYMVGLNAAFGFTAAFVNSFVSGEVVRIVLQDDKSTYVGGLTALCAAVAAVCSVWFNQVLVGWIGKVSVLMCGAIAFMGVALPFLVQPNLEKWNGGWLILVYSLQGVGRATFESTLKSLFADYFAYEKEGAFANIEFQNGISSSLGYMLSFRLRCSRPSTYCIPYKDGSLHNVLSLELVVLLTGLVAIIGLGRASILFAAEQDSGRPTRLSVYRRDSLASYRSSMSRMSGHIDDATFAIFDQFDNDA